MVVMLVKPTAVLTEMVALTCVATVAKRVPLVAMSGEATVLLTEVVALTREEMVG